MRYIRYMMMAICLLLASGNSLAEAADIADIQLRLTAHGYDPGSIDGLVGPQTRAAIRAFEADNDLPITGQATDALISRLAPARKLQPIVLRPEPAPVIAVSKAPTDRPAVALTAPVEPFTRRNEPTRSDREEPNFANRNWLIRDLDEAGQPTGSSFSIFLEANGHVAGPRFSESMRWREDDGALLIEYENAVGIKVERRGQFVSQNRLDGIGKGPDNQSWQWVAEAISVN